MKKLTAIAALTVVFALARANAGSTVYSWSGNQAVPDNNASGIAYSFYINTPSAEVISSVSVNLNIAGGWNGDLYSYLSHGSGFAVLLNRIGRTSGNPDGSSASGINVNLSDAYLADIHNFGGLPVGNFAPDGRNVNPFFVVNTDPRNATLGSFGGLNAAGFWTLYFADVSPLAVSTIQGWTVTITTAPVPEPSVFALLTVSAALAWTKRRR